MRKKNISTNKCKCGCDIIAIHTGWIAYAKCMSCGVEGDAGFSVSEAITAWNTRA